jgi:hypothetical protein
MGKKVLKKIKKLGCGIRTNLKSSVPNLLRRLFHPTRSYLK